MSNVYLIQIDTDKDLKELLKEIDDSARVRCLAVRTLEEYDERLYYDEMLGAAIREPLCA